MNEYFLMKHRKTLTFETLDTNFTHEISGFMYIIYEYIIYVYMGLQGDQTSQS